MSKIKAVAYYRMSSDKQETSIADQRTAVEEYAAKNGYMIVREYRDEGISGWKAEQRKGFQRLIEDANSKEFQAVLCWDQDRFSRFPVLEANHYWYLLDRAGVHISTVAQGRLNFEDLGEWLKASVVQHGKAEYCRDLARNTSRGLKKIKLEGRWVAQAPMGYRLHDGRLQLGDKRDIETVRLIFTMRTGGYGCYSIAKILNERGVPTPKGATWHAASVRQILKNQAYHGDTLVGRRARGRYARVIDGTITIENTHPAIIDAETWAVVERTWKTPQQSHFRAGSDGAALAGLVRCGRCGGQMYSASGTQYCCGTYRTSGKCRYCHVEREPLLAAVATKIRQHVLLGSRERLETVIQRHFDQRRPEQPDNREAVRKLTNLDQQIARASDRLLIVDDSLVDDLQQRLLAMKRQRDQLADSIREAPTPKSQPSAKAIASKLWELDRILREAPARGVRNALAQLIDHIRLNFRSVETHYRGQSYRFSEGEILLRTLEDNPVPWVY